MSRQLKYRIGNRDKGQVFDWRDVDNMPKDFTSGEVEFSQFTGVFDIEGKEIYEGDIIAIFQTQDVVDGMIVEKRSYDICEVIFFEGAFCTSEDDDICIGKYSESIEVIGNVYENIELLK